MDLRDAEEAAREARRCVKEFGFKAVQLNPVPVCGFCQLSGQDTVWAHNPVNCSFLTQSLTSPGAPDPAQVEGAPPSQEAR
jgi:hypothetical protein